MIRAFGPHASRAFAGTVLAALMAIPACSGDAESTFDDLRASTAEGEGEAPDPRPAPAVPEQLAEQGDPINDESAGGGTRPPPGSGGSAGAGGMGGSGGPDAGTGGSAGFGGLGTGGFGGFAGTGGMGTGGMGAEDGGAGTGGFDAGGTGGTGGQDAGFETVPYLAEVDAPDPELGVVLELDTVTAYRYPEFEQTAVSIMPNSSIFTLTPGMPVELFRIPDDTEVLHFTGQVSLASLDATWTVDATLFGFSGNGSFARLFVPDTGSVEAFQVTGLGTSTGLDDNLDLFYTEELFSFQYPDVRSAFEEPGLIDPIEMPLADLATHESSFSPILILWAEVI